MTASQSTLAFNFFHFSLFFVYFLTIQQLPLTPCCTSCFPWLPPSWVDLQCLVLGGFLGEGTHGGVESEAFKSLFISEAIRRHLVPHAQFVTEQNARRCPWGWPVAIALADTQGERGERKRERGGGRKESQQQQRGNEPDKGPETHPSHSAEPGGRRWPPVSTSH